MTTAAAARARSSERWLLVEAVAATVLLAWGLHLLGVAPYGPTYRVLTGWPRPALAALHLVPAAAALAGLALRVRAVRLVGQLGVVLAYAVLAGAYVAANARSGAWVACAVLAVWATVALVHLTRPPVLLPRPPVPSPPPRPSVRGAGGDP